MTVGSDFHNKDGIRPEIGFTNTDFLFIRRYNRRNYRKFRKIGKFEDVKETKNN